MSVFFLNNVSVDTVGDTYVMNGGERIIQVQAASFGGGTVTIEAKVDAELDWQTVPIQDGGVAEFTENAIVKFDFAAIGMNIRAKLTGSTSPSGVYVVMNGSSLNS